jgi:hypothetical protein
MEEEAFGTRAGLALVGVVVIVVIALATCSRNSHPELPEAPPAQIADDSFGQRILLVSQAAQFAYSVKQGGLGISNFANSLVLLTNEVRSAVAAAFVHEHNPQPTPYHGYVFRLVEYPPGDNFASNYRIIAEPAPGFTGNRYETNKAETPPPILP